MLIPNALIQTSQRSGSKVAVIDGDKTFTYHELAQRVSRLKHSLLCMGVQQKDRVGILMLNSFRYLELMYAIPAVGAIMVPLNVRLTADELSFILKDAEVQTLFLHREFLSLLPSLWVKTPCLNRVILAEDPDLNDEDEDGLPNYEMLLSQEEDEPLLTEDLQEEDIAALYYTGGTTGRSKGVMLTHRNLVSNAFHGALAVGYGEDDRYLHAAPMFHMADGASTYAVTLMGGTHVHLRSFQVEGVLQLWEKEKVTCGLLVPTMVNMLINHPKFSAYKTNTMRKVIYGGSPMPKEVLKQAILQLPEAQFIQLYGMSEAAPILTVLKGSEHLKGLKTKGNLLSSCGRPVPGVEMKVVDQAGEQVGAGVVGEIAARGPNIMKGYWNLPDETALALRDGWYHSGDLAYRDVEGYYYVVDRAKDMIISGGENIYSIEVENILYKHPAVLECAVIGIPDEKWGESVLGVVVVRPGQQISSDELISFTKEHLAGFKVPRGIVFVENLPKSGAGKILKRMIRENYWEGQDRRVH